MDWVVRVDSGDVQSMVPMEQLEFAVGQCTLGSSASRQKACSWGDVGHHSLVLGTLHSGTGTVGRIRSFAYGPLACSCKVYRCLAVGRCVAV